MSALFRRLKWIIAGINTRRLHHSSDTTTFEASTNGAKSPPLHLSIEQQRQQELQQKLQLLAKRTSNNKRNCQSQRPQPMLEAAHEIAIYIHRFHNLDLFQQGWYQLKITMRWEDSDYGSLGMPSRVVQYEAPDLGSDDVYGVWRIDDVENSFSTPPFRIRYARQDILLSMMVAFNMSLNKNEGPPTSAVILKFELLYAPIMENGSGLKAVLEGSPAAIHEFRLPPKALLGLHSYCPVHFDVFHAVLVDVTVHISLLKGGYASQLKVPSDDYTDKYTEEDISDADFNKTKQVVLLKAFASARDILIEEIKKISKAINQAIDITDFTSKPEYKQLYGSTSKSKLKITDGEDSGQVSSVSESPTQKSSASVDPLSAEALETSSKDDLLSYYHSLGNQTLYLWSTFLTFHRANKAKVLEYLRDVWAVDRRAEWSIWMVYSKVDMPYQYISSDVDSASYHGARGRAPVLKKLTEDPAQAAALRAELHRRSIAQMKINNRSIQDMHIFEDPSRIPIVMVERAQNAPRRTLSGNSYLANVEHKDADTLLSGGSGAKTVQKVSSGQSTRQTSRILKIVVFVHGFQGHHLDLRLVRNQWLLIDPKVEFLMSEANEDKTSGDFREMGQRLAQEVTSFIKKKMDKFTRSGGLKTIKLSFVGHSIGNVILRTALTESIMEPYLRYLHTYLSVSGPHLGYLYSPNSLFNSGLWLLKKLKNTQCIHQLTFTDDPDLQNTFLYKLCKARSLADFKNIILLSSPQDGYVPYHSARIEMCQASSGDNSKKGKVFLEMLNECLDQIRAPSSEHRTFMRCDVNFDPTLQGRNLNTMIGRAAHIEFLETDLFARFLMWSFPELFR